MKRITKNIILIILPLFLVFFGNGQKPFTVYLTGQVNNKNTGAPIENHEIIIESDTSYNASFVYSTHVITDSLGFYYDTIKTALKKGSIRLTTYDYLQNKYDTNLYFRFNWNEYNQLVSNFEIQDSLVENSYQANFIFKKDTSFATGNTFNFFDISNTDNIESWYWNFGDGSYSTEQNPVHTFDTPGLYRVNLTIRGYFSSTNEITINSVSRLIHIPKNDYFHFGGHIMAGLFPIDIGKAYLYKIEEPGAIVAIDSAVYDTMGYYYFYQVIEGDYLIKTDVYSESSHYQDFFPTYYGNVLYWQEADTINLTQSYFDYDVSLIPVENSKAKDVGSLEGKIIISQEIPEPKGLPAPNIEILLQSPANNAITYCHSEHDGIFSFEGLEFGNYKIYAEVAGKLTFPVVVEINPNHPNNNEILIIIGTEQIHGNINTVEELAEENFGLAYPNPAEDQIFMEANPSVFPEFQVLLVNTKGTIVDESHISNSTGSFKFNVSRLTPGTYYAVILTQNNEKIVRTFIKK